MRTKYFLVILTIFGGFLGNPAAAANDHEESRIITWKNFSRVGKIISGEVQTDEKNGSTFLHTENDKSAPLTIPLLVMDKVSPTTSQIALQGKISYKDVEGEAYLEMLVTMPDGQKYFSKTVSNSGTMAKITGTSEGREVMLPFNFMNKTPEQVKLEVNAVFPGKGSISLSPFRIVNISPDRYRENKKSLRTKTAALIGGIIGVICGLLFGLIVLLYRKGVSPKIINITVYSMFIIGPLFIVLGVVAALNKFSYPIYSAFIMVGGMLTIFIPFGFRSFQKKLKEQELRKIQALDSQ